MTRVTDEMVEAGLAAIDHVHEGYALNYGEMRAALEAAAEAAPADDTTEFEAALDTYAHDAALVEHHATRAVLAAASSLADGNDVGVRYDGTVKYWREQADAARQRLIDLFREAAR